MAVDPIILRGTSPGPQLYAAALHSAYLVEWPIIDPDFAQQSDMSIWDKIHRDGKIIQGINQRTATIASKNWIVEARGETEPEINLAELVKEILENIDDFHAGRRFLAQAVFRGRAYLFVEGERQTCRLGGLPPMAWWLPTRLRHIDKRAVRLVPDRRRDGDREVVVVRRELFRPSDGRWITLDQMTRRLLLEIVYDDEQGRLGYGRGLLEALYFLWWAKGVVLKEGCQAVERWAQGFLVAKVDTEKPGSTSANTAAIRNAARDELEAHRSRHVAVMDKADEVDLVTGGGEGWQIAIEMLRYLDDCIMATSMGSIRPFGGGDAGSFARARVEEETSDELLEFDRGIVDQTLTRGLIPLVIDNNREILSRLGLLDIRSPRFSTSQEKRDDPEKNARVVETTLRSGVPLKKTEVYERVGFSAPAEDDEVFEGVAQATPSQFFPAGMS